MAVKSKPRIRSASPAGSQATNTSGGAMLTNNNNQNSFVNKQAPNRSAIMSYTTSGTSTTAAVGVG